MDPASYCVYNATRNVLLSERVISVSEPQTPAQLLALVMNGPGRDPHSCIRLNNVSAGVSAAPEIPRLFAFDVACLDSEQRIVATADVGPSTPFPPVSGNVTTILFLSDQLLPNSKSEAGDVIRICTGAELAAILRATARFHAIESSAHPLESAVPQVAPDPFDGSLIYVPSSGVPQTREMFVPPAGRSSELRDAVAESGFTAESGADLSGDFIGSGAGTECAIEEVQGQIGQVAASRTEESAGGVSPNLASGVRSDEPAQAPLPRTSQLPFNLRAVIDLVDEQLRRERQQEEASDAQQPHWLAEAIVSAEASAAETHSEDLARGASRPISEPTIQVPAMDPRVVASRVSGVSGVSELSQKASSASARVQSHSANAEPLIVESAKPEKTAAPARVPEALEAKPAVVIQRAQTPEAVVEPALPSGPSAPPPVRDDKPVVREEVPTAPPAPARAVPIAAKEKLPFASRVQRWLSGDSVSLSGNRRRGERVAMPGLVAFYFTGGAPKPHEIVNISSSGLYLRSKELWSPNTLVRMTLERDDPAGAAKRSISVLARVVRVDEGGIGHEFVTTEVLARLNARDFLPTQGTNRKELDRFLAASK